MQTDSADTTALPEAESQPPLKEFCKMGASVTFPALFEFDDALSAFNQKYEGFGPPARCMLLVLSMDDKMLEEYASETGAAFTELFEVLQSYMPWVKALDEMMEATEHRMAAAMARLIVADGVEMEG